MRREFSRRFFLPKFSLLFIFPAHAQKQGGITNVQAEEADRTRSPDGIHCFPEEFVGETT